MAAFLGFKGESPLAIKSALIKTSNFKKSLRYFFAKVVLPAPLGPAITVYFMRVNIKNFQRKIIF